MAMVDYIFLTPHWLLFLFPDYPGNTQIVFVLKMREILRIKWWIDKAREGQPW